MPTKRLLKKGEQKASKLKMGQSSKARQKFINSYIDRHLTLFNETDEYHSLKPEQIAFAIWFAEPKEVRETLTSFAKKLGVTRETLWHWKHNPTIIDLRHQVMTAVVKEYAPDVLHNLAQRATNPDPQYNAIPAIKLFLQYVEEWQENAPDKPNIEVRFGFGKSHFINPVDSKSPGGSPKRKSVVETMEKLRND